VADCACALSAGVLASGLRFAGDRYTPDTYLACTALLPAMWWAAVRLAGGYDARFIGLGSDEFRRILNAAVSLTAAIAVVSYAAKLDLARGYMAIALPTLAILDLAVRYLIRKNLHRLRSRGLCTRQVIAVGHAAAVAELVITLRRESYHGLSVVAACLADASASLEVAGVPVAGELGAVAAAVGQFGADSVAVLTCPEMTARACASWPGSWRRRAPTCASRPPCSTSPGRGRPSARSRACRCCTWTTRSWRGAGR